MRSAIRWFKCKLKPPNKKNFYYKFRALVFNIKDTSVSAFHNVPSSHADCISYLITSFTFQPLTTLIIDSTIFKVKQKVEILHFTTCFNL